MKKVLITGANSYIGVSFEAYVQMHYGSELSIETVDMIDGSWRSRDFSGYDIVYHVAGLAHADVGNVDEATRRKYYAINTDLAVETAKKAKQEGVGQFVFMSSAIIYGDSAPFGIPKRITADTEPNPTNFYGDSKWRADKAIRALEAPGFKVTVLRPPMIYGKNSKGNYPMLAAFAKKAIFFPDVRNERSVLYIENLCVFLAEVMIQGCGGIFWPQNAEYAQTSEMVRLIAEAVGHRIIIVKGWNWLIRMIRLIPGRTRGMIDKAFGNMSYDRTLSDCGFPYQVVDFKESIRRTEEP